MDINDILILSDNNKYIIASKASYDYKIYLCLVDIVDNKNIKFCYLDNDEVILIKKEDLNHTLLLKLLRSMAKNVKDNM